jgi:hypothetical protein
MPATRQILHIFLSSPGDVGPQREIVRETINHIANDPLVSNRILLQVVGWDNPGARVPLSANHTPQLAVNDYILAPHQCDLTIAIVWSRLGTQIPKDTQGLEGRTSKSGTLWEIDDALKSGKSVWIYRKTTTPLTELTDIHLETKRQQLRDVEDFFATSTNSDGSIRFGVHSFADDEDLRSLLGEHLRHYIRKKWDEESQPVDDRHDPIVASDASYQSSALHLAVESALFNQRDISETKEKNEFTLSSLKCYPIGPMIKDVVVRHLALALAEIHHAADPRTTFAEINAALRQASGPNDPQLRLSLVMFSTTLGSKHFWEDVLHHAAIQGPRMLSAVLLTVNAKLLEQDASDEFFRLVQRVNSYV